ncbi:MAG: hypothetical protein GJ680_07675 [Alteromonadaceae bacterium]|nr:hypothetical protein [Alteromonadaceae bacterium]
MRLEKDNSNKVWSIYGFVVGLHVLYTTAFNFTFSAFDFTMVMLGLSHFALAKYFWSNNWLKA